MNIVAITACPTGIAYTYMAAESLEKSAKALGHRIKVETQGAMGIENQIEPKDVAKADVVILAVDTQVEQRQRFDGKRIIEVSVQLALKDPKSIFAQAS